MTWRISLENRRFLMKKSPRPNGTESPGSLWLHSFQIHKDENRCIPRLIEEERTTLEILWFTSP
jgi:hypothetical protein